MKDIKLSTSTKKNTQRERAYLEVNVNGIETKTSIKKASKAIVEMYERVVRGLQDETINLNKEVNHLKGENTTLKKENNTLKKDSILAKRKIQELVINLDKQEETKKTFKSYIKLTEEVLPELELGFKDAKELEEMAATDSNVTPEEYTFYVETYYNAKHLLEDALETKKQLRLILDI